MRALSRPATDRDGFRFRGGHVALDLAATLAGRARTQPRELLGTPDDLDRWLASAGFAADGASAADVARARALREAIYALASARLASTADTRSATAINDIAAGSTATLRLDADGRAELRGTAAQMLTTIAREAILLFGGEREARVRRCDGDGCSILFVDTSRGGDRRWCSMAGCGNRAKLADFRQRQRAAGE